MAGTANKTTRYGVGKGIGGPRNGPGYGGSARGNGGPVLKPTGDPLSDAARALSHDPAHLAVKEAIKAEMLAIQITAAREGETAMVRAMVADKVLDRLAGKPTQTIEAHSKVDLTDARDSLAERIARVAASRGAGGGAGDGDAGGTAGA